MCSPTVCIHTCADVRGVPVLCPCFARRTQDVVDVTDRLRAVQTQLRARDDRVRELEGTLGHLRDQLATAQADAQATATALQQRERDVEHSNTALERARSEHHTQVQELRDQANRYARAYSNVAAEGPCGETMC